MRIQNSFVYPSADLTTAVQTSSVTVQQQNNSESVPGSATEHVPAPQLLQLAAQAQQFPDIRENRVAEVAKRLASGEYLTPDAALRTADALMAAPE